MTPLDKMDPWRAKSAPGAIELNRHFGAETDLLNLQCNHYIVEVVMAMPRVYIVFAVISLTFAGLSKLSKYQTNRPNGSLAAILQHYNDNAYNNCIRL